MWSFLAAARFFCEPEARPNSEAPKRASDLPGPVLLGREPHGSVAKRKPALLPSAAMRRLKSDPKLSGEIAATMTRLKSDPKLSGGTAKPLIPGLKGSCSALHSTPMVAPQLRPPTACWKMFVEHGEEALQLQDVYEVEDEVRGKGGFGTIRLARLVDAPAVVRAVKTVSKRNLREESVVRREINILKQLDHPCICRLHETFEDECFMYMVMEFIDGCELFDEIVRRGQLDEGSARTVMQQCFSSLKYCHERNVIHKDIKPENIMIHKTTSSQSPGGSLAVKLIDFGLAVICTTPADGRAGSSVEGSEDYMPPEARKGRCVPVSDMWSAGIVMHLLLTGFLPRPEVLIGAGPLDTECREYAAMPRLALDLLSGLLQPDTQKRLTAAAAAAHPWTCSPAADGTMRMEGSLAALQSFHRSQKLRRAALTALATQLTSVQMEELREQFMLIDADQNGRISREELGRAMAAQVPEADADEQADLVEAIFDAVDTDGSNEIEYTEWMAAALQEGACLSRQDAWAAFRVFDVDGSGCINQQELAHVLSQTPKEIADLMPQVDTNGDGVIDFDEFCSVLVGVTTL